MNLISEFQIFPECACVNRHSDAAGAVKDFPLENCPDCDGNGYTSDNSAGYIRQNVQSLLSLLDKAEDNEGMTDQDFHEWQREMLSTLDDIRADVDELANSFGAKAVWVDAPERVPLYHINDEIRLKQAEQRNETLFNIICAILRRPTLCIRLLFQHKVRGVNVSNLIMKVADEYEGRL